jgi:putative PIN family toxin of toxin-antitoxin system
MPKKIKRVIIDTNLWISFLITNNLNILSELFLFERFQIIFSDELFNEFLDVARRPKFKKYFDEKSVQLLIGNISEKLEFIEVASAITICRDLKDNFILALSIDGNVDYIVTGDKDLLSLNGFKGKKIITINEFIKIIDTEV